MFEEENPTRIKNEETGMDMCVDTYKEASGPLGGTSIEYRIDVATTQREYKNRAQLSDNTSIVTITAYKTFKEIEYFHKKLRAKYANVVALPSLACDISPLNEDREMRKRVANEIMSFIAKDKTLSASTLLFSFLGYDPHKNSENTQIKPPSRSTKKEPSKSSGAVATNTSTDPFANSDDMFLETKDGKPSEEEDLFQEFKRQNISGSAGDVSTSTLFARTPPKKQQLKSHREDDLFLFSRQDMGGALRRDELDANGLLVSSHDAKDKPSKSQADLDSKLKVDEMEELLTIDNSLSDIWKEMHEPKKVAVELATSKPEVKTKPTVARKPSLPPKPVATSGNKVPAKPSVPVPAPRNKPVPSPRRSSTTSSDVDVTSADKEMGEMRIKSSTSVTVKKQPETAADLSALDILTYIDSEQHQQSQNLDLFS